MKINYTTTNQRINVEIESQNAKDAFKQLAEFQEVFDEQSCGMCQSQNIQFIVRTVDSNDYYELKCKQCTAKLAFGQHKAGGTLFPKRKKEDGSYDYQFKGWHKWSPGQEHVSTVTSQQSTNQVNQMSPQTQEISIKT